MRTMTQKSQQKIEHVSHPLYSTNLSGKKDRNNPLINKGLLAVLLERVSCLGPEAIPDDGVIVLAIQHREQDRAQFGRLLEVQSCPLTLQRRTEIRVRLRAVNEDPHRPLLNLGEPQAKLLHPSTEPQDERNRHRLVVQDRVDALSLSGLQHLPDRLWIQARQNAVQTLVVLELHLHLHTVRVGQDVALFVQVVLGSHLCQGLVEPLDDRDTRLYSNGLQRSPIKFAACHKVD